jgi:P-type conjugative transfer protein TrbJ
METKTIKGCIRALAFAGVCAVGLAGRLNAGAVIGATEPTQILNNIQLVAQYAKQVQMVLQQAQNATVSLNGLAINFQQGSGVAYAAAAQDAAFTQFHQTFAQYAAKTAGMPTPATYQQWIQYNTDAANRAANAAGLTIAQASSEQARIAALKAAGQTPQGQVQAVMAGNALAAEELDQLRALNRLIAQQMDTEARYHRIEEEKKTQDLAATANANAQPANTPDPKAAKTYGAMPSN